MEYQKYEFCKDITCEHLRESGCSKPNMDLCDYTAKRFHWWLQKNNYRIIKKNDEQGNPILSHTIRVK